MKAFVLRSYGSPDHLDLTEVDIPVPTDDEVLVRVRATSVNPYDWHFMRGQPYVARLMPGDVGLRGPAVRVLGCDVAGEVEAVGRNVTAFRRGDEVFALLKGGGYGEYVCAAPEQLTPKPANQSFEEAAAVPMAAVTALLGLRDEGRIQPGQNVLVNGASGGVGTFAVQLARSFGAAVTGVCSARHVELVRSLGADTVIDRTAADVTRLGRRYDLLLDAAGGHSLRALRRALTPEGTVVVVGGRAGRWVQPAGHVFATLAMGAVVSQRVTMVDTVGFPGKAGALRALTEHIESGAVAPVIDRRYPYEELPTAVAYAEEGHVAGKLVVTVQSAS
jgi:NADPH:quinone reductase-like Zn-dependent oxidoreductase